MILTSLLSTWRDWKFSLKERYYLYSNPSYKQVDRYLVSIYRKKSPYHIAKEFFSLTQISPLYSYGETPLLTGFYLMKAGGVHYDDTIVDLGAGAGRLSVFLTFFFTANVVAVEANPYFCQTLRKVQSKWNLSKLKIVEGDFFELDLPDGTIYYLCQLFLSEEEIQSLIARILVKSFPLKIISVAIKIDHPSFLLYHQETGSFLWGKSEVYYYQKS